MEQLTESSAQRQAVRNDEGFSLLELLIVILILGVITAVATFSVRGMTRDGAESVCGSDRQTLSTAIEVYMGQRSATTIPGGNPSERMTALVEAGLLRSRSSSFAIEMDGRLTAATACA